MELVILVLRIRKDGKCDRFGHVEGGRKVEILRFLIENWGNIVVAAFIIVMVLYTIKTGQTKILLEIAYKLVADAEGEAGGGTGSIKRSAVVKWLYEQLPPVVKTLFTEKDLVNIVEKALEKAKADWEKNQAAVKYIESR